MALENNLDANNDIAQFLEKFKDTPRPQPPAQEDLFTGKETAAPRPAQYARSFEKLEQKILELEEKFEASSTQNHLILNELSRTREAMERQRDKDAFLEHISRTIATLRTSVDNLTRAQETNSFSFRPAAQRNFDPLPEEQVTLSSYDTARAAEQEVTRLKEERAEQNRLFSSLRQKASQLKAVNSALDREIKKAQQEKLDALKKSADQAKEILSLRDQLTAAEERFKSFDFEGRIISIKRQYQQKVSTLETQLKEMSDTCMRQVEEIESLKAKNTELQEAVAQKEALQAQLADKDKQLEELKNNIAMLQTQHVTDHEKQLADYTARLRTLEEQRTELSLALEKSQLALGTLRQEKEVLEKNFKELVVKINHNDAVIGQLKEKIDVLGRQNTELSHQNTALTQRNQELTQTATVLMSNNEKLAQTNQHLTQDNAALTQRNQHLTQDNNSLQQENQHLSQNNASLTQANAHLSKDNQTLSSANQTLLKDKQSLRAANQTLTRDNQTLSAANQTLIKDNQALSATNQTLTRDNKNLSQTNSHLASDNKTLVEANQHLAQDNEKLSQTNLHLTRKNEVLVQKQSAPKKAQPQQHSQQPVQEQARPEERAQLTRPEPPAARITPEVSSQRSAALLAARLVQEHAQKQAAAKAKQNAKIPLSKEQIPLGALPQAQEPVLHSLGRNLSKISVPAEEEWEVVSAQPAVKAVHSEADLPEIKVADPILQEELVEGEDFLEKTNSFVGRMKWSIFRENR